VLPCCDVKRPRLRDLLRRRLVHTRNTIAEVQLLRANDLIGVLDARSRRDAGVVRLRLGNRARDDRRGLQPRVSLVTLRHLFSYGVELFGSWRAVRRPLILEPRNGKAYASRHWHCQISWTKWAQKAEAKIGLRVTQSNRKRCKHSQHSSWVREALKM